MANKPAEKIDIAFGKNQPSVQPVRKNRIEPLSSKDELPDPTLDDQVASNEVESRPPSSELDGGFSADMSAEASTPAEEDTPKEPEVAASEDAHDDSVYGSDEDFYSSKLDPSYHEEPEPEPEKEEVESSKHTEGKAKKRRLNPQYLLVLATFVTVSLLGLFILHTLETAQEGAGIIFDWLG